jgi:photoactive yellow protein
MEKLNYTTVDVGSIVNRIPEESKDRLPFGLIKLDKLGKILEYNMAQASLAGISAKEAIGKNFFLDLAVCTQRPEFFGKFKEGVDRGILNTVFEFTFDLRMTPTRVRVHMVLVQQSVFLMVKKLGPAIQAASVAHAPSTSSVAPHGGLPAREDTKWVDADLSPILELKDVKKVTEAMKSNSSARVEDIVFKF